MFTPQVIFLTVLVFFVLVGFHEFGHFYFAKRAGVLVREYAIGFGPKLFSFKRGETRYTLRIFPAGGYVLMAGEDPETVDIQPGQTIAVDTRDDRITHMYLDKLDDRSDKLQGVVERIDLEHGLKLSLEINGETRSFAVDPQAVTVQRGKEIQIAPADRQFGNKTLPQRAMSIFAGPLMNFILSFVLFVAFAALSGVPQHIKIVQIINGSAASASQLQPGDVVISVNGQDIGTNHDKFVNIIEKSAGKQMIWEVRRGGQLKAIKITPKSKDGHGFAGVSTTYQTRAASLSEVFKNSTTEMWHSTQLIFIGLKQLFTLHVKLDDLAGPVGMVQVTGQAASMGIATLVRWTAILSLYLGIFNLIPFPALDGSRLMFLAIEAVRGKPVDPNRESMVHFIGLAMMMMLMLAVTYNDILRLFRG